jgi:predicted Rossmann fold flavoprotein
MQIVVVGGGASGFMAAITAAETFPKARVRLLEKSRNVLSKVRVSGGGRCNVTHRPSAANRFAKNYPRGEKLLKSILSSFGPEDTIEWFESRGVRLKTEADGRIFPTTDASDTVVHALMESARKAGVEILTNVEVNAFSKDERHFQLELSSGVKMSADRLIVATGGSPKLQGFDWISTHQHTITSPVPSLFTFNTPGNYLLPLAGVSVPEVRIKVSNTNLKSEGPILITHWGFSGPAILKLSAWGARQLADLNYQFQIRINWTSDFNFDQVRQYLYDQKASSPKHQLAAHHSFGIPSRLWRTLVERADIPAAQKLADTTHKSLNKLATFLTECPFEIAGKTTFKEEFVTCGGVSLHEVKTDTMESKIIDGLFFTGEVLDVDGITGGFNFQNAWSTGYIAGKHVGIDTTTN